MTRKEILQQILNKKSSSNVDNRELTAMVRILLDDGKEALSKYTKTAKQKEIAQYVFEKINEIENKY